MSGFLYRQLAKASQQERVVPGRKISVKVDLALAHDGTGPEILKHFNGVMSGSGCSRVIVTLDHAFPAPSIKDRQFQRDIAEFARKNHIHLFKNGEGVLHQVVAEEESLWPGMVIVGADGHVATAGAFGALAFSVSAAAFADVLQSGRHDLVVPQQMVISLEGRLKSSVMARDIAMHIAASLGKAIKGKAVLLSGGIIDNLSISEKMAICNFLPEAGVATTLVLPQGEQEPCDVMISAGDIGPMLAAPGTDKFVTPGSCRSQVITMAIAGGCSSGRLDDMRVIADVLAGNEVHPGVTFIITPGSRNILASMDKLGLSAILRDAGAVIMPPGCGPCPGKHFGVLCESDTAITTTIRNNPGRIGSTAARIFLASPLTVALSAIQGKITGPHEIQDS